MGITTFLLYFPPDKLCNLVSHAQSNHNVSTSVDPHVFTHSNLCCLDHFIPLDMLVKGKEFNVKLAVWINVFICDSCFLFICFAVF